MKSKNKFWSPPKSAVLLLVAIVAAVPVLLFTGSITADVLIVAGMFGAAVATDQLIQRSDCNKNGGPVAASTTLYQGTMAFWNASGFVDDDTASGVNRFAGIVPSRVTNSGSNGDVSTDLWSEGVFVLVGSGFTQADVDKPVYATNNHDIVLTKTGGAVYIGTVARFVSSTQLAVRIDTEDRPLGQLNTIVQTVAFGAFTDGGGTSGHIDLSTQLPAGAIPLGWKSVVGTGFTGDTTAVMQVGVSGDVDRFSNMTTKSVFAAGTVGSGSLGRAEVLDGIGAASTIRVTVTGGADFTSINAGSLTITFYYHAN